MAAIMVLEKVRMGGTDLLADEVDVARIGMKAVVLADEGDAANCIEALEEGAASLE